MVSDILESYEEKLNINPEFFGLFRDELLKISNEDKNINFKSSTEIVNQDNCINNNINNIINLPNDNSNFIINENILPNFKNEDNNKLNLDKYNLSIKEIDQLNNIISYFNTVKK